MLPSCYGRLSRAAYTRPGSFPCKKKYHMTEVFVAKFRVPTTTLIDSSNSSASVTSPLHPSVSHYSPHPLNLYLMHYAAQGIIQNTWKDPVNISCRGIFPRALYSKLDLDKVSNGFALKHQSRIFSSISSEPKKVDTAQIVVVVESPAKAKAVQRFLGADFVVLPLHGHVRDLVARAGSVRPEDDYAMLWEVLEAAQPHLTRIKHACESAKQLVLATDPNREGEALAWHVVEVMKAEGLLRYQGLRVRRVLFNEVTKSAVLHAMQAPQGISFSLVGAYLAGRALDYLVDFALSPLLWRKLPGSRSAGRVHLAALQLVCKREKAVNEFVPQESWTLDVYACFADESESCVLTVSSLDGDLFDMSECLALAEKLKNSTLKAFKVSKVLKQRGPPEPYITSTLQEDAQVMLGFETERTMKLAQKLYEGVVLGKGELTGLITCPCTCGCKLSKLAARNIRAFIAQRFGNDYIPPIARECQSKVTNTIEASEAIRATNVQTLPSTLCQILDKDALSLYLLIWKRTVECQMEQAMYEEVSVEFVTEAEAVCLLATVNHLTFPGFLAASMDEETSASLRATWLSNHPDHQGIPSKAWDKVSALKEGDTIFVKKAEAHQHFTSPPVRYSEGLLVKAMAEAGIGRPSIYATIVKSLQAKKYVRIENQQIIPEVQGLMVTSFLLHFLSKFLDCNISAPLEKQLDEVSGGQLHWKRVLKEFWPAFNAQVSSVMNMSDRKLAQVLHEAFFTQGFANLGFKGRLCPRCGTGKLTLKKSRRGRGYYVSCNNHGFCSFKARVIGEEDQNAFPEELSVDLEKIYLGVHPATNLEVTVKTGPWGSYIQLGKEEKGLEFFKLPQGVKPGDMSLEKALQLMKYPLELGKHPEDGHVVVLGINNKSYFVKHQSTMALLSDKENVEEITLERALKLLKNRDKSQSKKRERERKKTVCIGDHENLLPVSSDASVSTEEKGERSIQKGSQKTEKGYSEEKGKREYSKLPSTCNRNVDTEERVKSEDGSARILQQVEVLQASSTDSNHGATVDAGGERPSEPIIMGVQEKPRRRSGRKKARFEAGKEAVNHVPGGIAADNETGEKEKAPFQTHI
ncbi:hypothetical protein GOP47_0008264 [Adiantum capillus-veneris]|uniref:DNA topoisomerase n=1 Tax=Adiantum capillus-veneris TaxID=13818 RepID=A0A9D4UYD6_ADICA|nr:hypothetical protein GOP47_0008264 [Adiantum capillus-veneris]